MTSSNHYINIQLTKYISSCFDLRNILLSNQTNDICSSTCMTKIPFEGKVKAMQPKFSFQKEHEGQSSLEQDNHYFSDRN